jgi:hypothetical protein
MKKFQYLILFLSLAFTSCDESDPLYADLKGIWIWKSTCGGFAGCSYPSDTNSQNLIIKKTQINIFTNNDLSFSKSYSIIDFVLGDNSVTYQIKFDDEEIWMVEISDNNLTIYHNSVIYSTYQRLM